MFKTIKQLNYPLPKNDGFLGVCKYISVIFNILLS